MGLAESRQLLVDANAVQGQFATSFTSWRTDQQARGLYEGTVNLVAGPAAIEVRLIHDNNGREAVQTAVFNIEIP